MGERIEASVEHLAERHLVVMPDVALDLRDEQLEQVILALHLDLHEREGWTTVRRLEP